MITKLKKYLPVIFSIYLLIFSTIRITYIETSDLIEVQKNYFTVMIVLIELGVFYFLLVPWDSYKKKIISSNDREKEKLVKSMLRSMLYSYVAVIVLLLDVIFSIVAYSGVFIALVIITDIICFYIYEVSLFTYSSIATLGGK